MTRAFTRADLADLAAILVEAADVEIMPRFKHLGAGDIDTKTGPLDLVTVADRAAERLITTRLAARFPGVVVVGEEATAEDPAVLDRLGDAPFAIVVDPIDGTFNFANGLPLFGVMAAVVVDGVTVAGVIYDPFGRDLACALLGQGAWLVGRDGGSERRLAVAAPAEVSAMHGPIGWPYLTGEARTTVAAHLPRLATAYGYRCAAHEYRLLATGGAHVVLYGKLMPWDHLAGVLIQQEAGGYAAKLDGTPYLPTDRGGGLLLAPDAASWRAVHAALFED